MPIPKQVSYEAPKSAKMRIYEALREWIIDGTLQPGEKILDSEISQYFSVSRTPGQLPSAIMVSLPGIFRARAHLKAAARSSLPSIRLSRRSLLASSSPCIRSARTLFTG